MTDGDARRTIDEPARDIDVYEEVDVLVIGGGPAGVCAAVGAARAGARTAIVERHGFFGGMWTAGMVLTLAGFNSWLRPYERCVAGVAGEWIERAADQGGALPGPGFVINSDPETMKRVADDLLEEAGVTMFLHTWGASPVMDGNRVAGAFVENVDGRRAILAKATVDASGDGDVVARSGAKWVKSDSLQPMTMTFRLGNAKPAADIRHDLPVTLPIGPEPGQLTDPILSQYASTRNDVKIDAAAMSKARDAGQLPRYGGPWFGGVEKDVVWVNATRVVGDASDGREFTRAEIQGRRDTKQIVDWFREHVPALEESRLLHTGTQIGVRETRRLVGELVMTGDDVRSSRSFEDSIAVGCWPIDVHPAEKVVGTHAMYVPRPFDISYRVLIPTNIDGLIAAGRCVSVDREALGSMRVGATCAAMGHAAGVAAAVSARASVKLREVDVDEVRAILRRQGALIDAEEVSHRAH